VNKLKITCVFSALLAMPYAGHADESDDARAAESLIKAFISICVEAVPNLDRVQDSAKRFGWKEAKLSDALPPLFRGAQSKTWLVEGAAEVPFDLSISLLIEGQQTTSACSLSNPEAPLAPIKSALTNQSDFGKEIRVYNDAAQKTTYWQKHNGAVDIYISLIDGSPVNEPGIILNAIVIQNPSLLNLIIVEIHLAWDGIRARFLNGYIESLSTISIIGFFVFPSGILAFVNSKRPNLRTIPRVIIFVSLFAIWGLFMVGLRWLVGFPFWLAWLGL
jgi:hypothetical protein